MDSRIDLLIAVGRLHDQITVAARERKTRSVVPAPAPEPRPRRRRTASLRPLARRVSR